MEEKIIGCKWKECEYAYQSFFEWDTGYEEYDCDRRDFIGTEGAIYIRNCNAQSGTGKKNCGSGYLHGSGKSTGSDRYEDIF